VIFQRQTNTERGDRVKSDQVPNAYWRNSEAAVLGAREPKWGGKIVAVICLRNGHDPSRADFAAYLLEHILGYKTPRRVVFIDTLPKNAEAR
jgi:fatty-acyl-CoA synthase